MNKILSKKIIVSVSLLILCLFVATYGYRKRTRIPFYMHKANVTLRGLLPANIDELSQLDIPLVEINTDGIEPTCTLKSAPDSLWGLSIDKAEKVKAAMTISLKGKVLYESGNYDKNNNGLKISVRGNGSAKEEKKPYKLKLEKKADLIENDENYADKDWVLLNYGENLRTEMGLIFGEALGISFVPRMKYVNVVINGNYRGLYILIENPKRSKSRINVSKDGFLAEYDAYWWKEKVYVKSPYTTVHMQYTFKYPKAKNITNEKKNEYQEYFTAFEKTVYEGGDYSQYIDVESWARWLVAQELMASPDAAGTNIYIAKENDDDSTKMTLPMLWDFDGNFIFSEGWSRIHSFKKLFVFYELLNHNDPTFLETYCRILDNATNTVFEFAQRRLKEYPQRNDMQSLETSRELDAKRWGKEYIPLNKEIKTCLKYIYDRRVWLQKNKK